MSMKMMRQNMIKNNTQKLKEKQQQKQRQRQQGKQTDRQNDIKLCKSSAKLAICSTLDAYGKDNSGIIHSSESTVREGRRRINDNWQKEWVII